MSISDVAALCDVPNTTVELWESDKLIPPYTVLANVIDKELGLGDGELFLENSVLSDSFVERFKKKTGIDIMHRINTPSFNDYEEAFDGENYYRYHPKALGKTLKSLRNKQHISISSMADEIYVNDEKIKRYESGKDLIDAIEIGDLESIALKLGFSLERLICLSEKSDEFDGIVCNICHKLLLLNKPFHRIVSKKTIYYCHECYKKVFGLLYNNKESLYQQFIKDKKV